MKRALTAALIGCVAALGLVSAQDQCCMPFSRYIGEYSRFTIGGGYARRHLHEDRLETTLAQVSSSGTQIVQANRGPTANEAEGNWGIGFIRYEFFAPCALYTAVRGTWAGGHLHPHQNVQAWFIPPTTSTGTLGAGNVPVSFTHYAHEWNAEWRIGYTWLSMCDWNLALFTGAGYRGGHFNLIGRSRYHWWYIPVGFKTEWDFCSRWSVGLDAEVGLMASAWFLPEDQILGFWGGQRPFDNRYEWQIELPVGYEVYACGNTLWIELVPFWEGWKTGDRLINEAVTSHPNSMGMNNAGDGNGIGANSIFLALEGPSASNPVGPPATDLSANAAVGLIVGTRQAALAAPRLINSTLGFRIDLTTHF
jgi:hypothetical protein